jgi:hypothetical protein
VLARICANTGWTWDYVRNHVDLPTLQALEDEWLDNPPVHRMVATYLGYERPAEIEAKNDESLLALMAGMPVNTSAPKLDNSAWETFVATSKETPNG